MAETIEEQEGERGDCFVSSGERERERRNGPYKWAVSSFAFVPPFTKEDST